MREEFAEAMEEVQAEEDASGLPEEAVESPKKEEKITPEQLEDDVERIRKEIYTLKK
jgi:hypothetical protein